MKSVYDAMVGSCASNETGLESSQWSPRDCCPTHRVHDKRTPGLFKVSS